MHMPTILLIRPENRIAADAEICQAAGWQAVPFSPLKLVADEAALATLALQIRDSDVVFWVSPSAVELAAPFLPENSSAVHIAVGKATAEQLKRKGCLKVVCPTEGKDSEAVLKLSIWNNLPKQAKILIVRGHGGRELLAQSLIEQGFQVAYAEIYFRQPEKLDWQWFVECSPSAVWVTSSEWVRELFAQVPPPLSANLQSLLYFTHHPRIAAALRQFGVRRIELIERLDSAILTRYTEQTDERAKSTTSNG